MSKYQQIREEMDAFITEVVAYDEMYSLAVAARMILPQDGTPDPEAKILLEQCIGMFEEIWVLLSPLINSKPWAVYLYSRVDFYLGDLYASFDPFEG